jgi:hypothetical protein
MRTTIRLDDHLLAEVKQLAMCSGKSMTVLVEEALREMLARQRFQAKSPRTKPLPSWGEGWLQPGVDLDNSAALWDLLDDLDAPDRR